MEPSDFQVIQFIIDLIVFIVFFAMAANISRIKKEFIRYGHLDKQKQLFRADINYYSLMNDDINLYPTMVKYIYYMLADESLSDTDWIHLKNSLKNKYQADFNRVGKEFPDFADRVIPEKDGRDW